MMFAQYFPRRRVLFRIVVIGLLAMSFFACRTLVPDTPVAVETEPIVTEVIPTEAVPTQTVPAITSVPFVTATDDIPPSSLASAGDPYAPELGNTGIDVIHYTLNLAFDPKSSQPDEFTATVVIEATATQPLDEIWLDFVGFEISNLLVNDLAAHFERRDDKLVIVLDTSLQAGESFQIAISYAGRPEIRRSPYVPFIDHLGLLYSEPDNLFVLAEPDGARFWFPCNDHPRDKAKFAFTITVPGRGNRPCPHQLVHQ